MLYAVSLLHLLWFDKSKYMKPITKQILMFCGIVSVGTGVVGMFLPILPTTPFLLLAGACFARCSEKAYNWLLTNRWCGEYIKNYRESKVISLKHKILLISLLWVTIGYSALFIAAYLWLKLLLLIIASGVTFHILKIYTCKRRVKGNACEENVVKTRNRRIK